MAKSSKINKQRKSSDPNRGSNVKDSAKKKRAIK